MISLSRIISAYLACVKPAVIRERQHYVCSENTIKRSISFINNSHNVVRRFCDENEFWYSLSFLRLEQSLYCLIFWLFDLSFAWRYVIGYNRQDAGLPVSTFVRKAYITIAIRLRYDYDTTIPRRIRLRRKWSKLRFAFDSTAIRLRHDYYENWHVHFLLSSNRVEWKQARTTS